MEGTDEGQVVFALFIDIAACVTAYFGRYGWWRLWICTMVSDGVCSLPGKDTSLDPEGTMLLMNSKLTWSTRSSQIWPSGV